MSESINTASTSAHEPSAGLSGRIVLVTGLSGAGRTSALKVLEDLGCEAVDNLPLRLLPTLVEQGPAAGRGLAIGVDIRTRDFVPAAFAGEIARLGESAGVPVDIVFLDCDDEVLQRRYTETRRVHPMAGDRPLADGIAAERQLLAPLRDAASIVIDTSHTNIRDFARSLRGQMIGPATAEPQVLVVSFAYRNGVPRDADLVFDVRFLRNPHYSQELRPLTGRDALVGAYIDGDEDFQPFFERLTALLELLLPRFAEEGKSYLTLAVGCTGGRHRSVYVAEKLGAWLGGRAARVDVRHRELPVDGPAYQSGAANERP